MGWGSATGIFDSAVDVVLSFLPENPFIGGHEPLLVYAVVYEMYTKVAWDDWDTQDESKYAETLYKVRVDCGEIDEDE